MRAMFPNETGFSSANLRYMKRWYQFYYEQVVILHQPDEELGFPIRQRPVAEFVQQAAEQIHTSSIRQHAADESPRTEILQRFVEELGMPEIFGHIPWGQHIEIFTKCKSLEESLFYINKTIENNWSRSRYVSIKIMRSGPFGMKNSRSGGSPLWTLWQP